MNEHMNETYLVEFLHLGNKHAPTVIDCAASPDHDFETAKAHALETFRQAQTGPMRRESANRSESIEIDHLHRIRPPR